MISEQHPRSQRRRTQVGLLFLAVIWGLNFPIIKSALGEFSPLAFNALRFPLASLVLVGLMAARRGPMLPHREDVSKILALGLLANVLYQLLFIYGLDRTLAGNASLLLSTTPVWTAILSSLAGHERLPVRVWVGLAGTVMGMVLVITGGGTRVDLGGETFIGDVLTIAASMTWSVYTVSGRNLIHRYGSMSVTAWTLWTGTIVLIGLGVVPLLETELGTVSASAWFGVAYAGIMAIGLAYLLWNRGVRILGNSRTAVHSNLVPVVALTAAWVALGERPTLAQLIGAAVIIGGVTLTLKSRTEGT